MYIGDLMRCGTPTDAEVTLTFGTNIETSCKFNFNHLLNQINGKQYQAKMYQLLVLGNNGSYFDVPVYMAGSSQPIRRFFLEDTVSSTTTINVLTALTLSFTFSGGQLVSPSLVPTYSSLGTTLGTGVNSGS